jgi:hypothetical protein
MIKDLFNRQFKYNSIVTEKSIRVLTDPVYHSGREVKVGDLVLWAKYKDESGDRIVVMVHPDDLNLYRIDRTTKVEEGDLPHITFKKKRAK